MKIEIKQNILTDYWHVFIDDVDAMKAKRLLTLTKTLTKFIKGHPELVKDK